MFNRYFDQYEIGEIWTSRGRTITETDLVLFSAFSGDWYPLHTNKEYAANTPFQQRIAHGMLVLSVATGLIQFEPDIIAAFYGMERVRFTNPTFIGDTIQVELRVIDLLERNSRGGIVTVIQEVKKQTSEIVTVAEMKLLVNRKIIEA
ncbi:MaoC/PaaZ C-terminal domain-containing protein [Ammoniphilus resinae]|uniref:Acyl dehydratase n=1 Tax=Ammoniphilus resinae TaxID=861532 RepID=A0ABS4GM01_9BACL|nr:MaoC/PaaZ C-terminal domain-containing protein [Ammoniphilus resinae]MBP1931307.1 acyl dehydratase [Ammoniphilus resinae]